MMCDAKVCIGFAFIEGDMFIKTWGAVEERCCLTSVTFEFVSINPKNTNPAPTPLSRHTKHAYVDNEHLISLLLMDNGQHSCPASAALL